MLEIVADLWAPKIRDILKCSIEDGTRGHENGTKRFGHTLIEHEDSEIIQNARPKETRERYTPQM